MVAKKRPTTDIDRIHTTLSTHTSEPCNGAALKRERAIRPSPADRLVAKPMTDPTHQHGSKKWRAKIPLNFERHLLNQIT